MNFCQNLFCLSQILCHFVQFLYNYLKNLISQSFCVFLQLNLLLEFPFHLHFFQAQNFNNHIAKRSTSFLIRSAAKKNMDHKSQPQGIHSTKWITNMDHGFLKRSAPYSIWLSISPYGYLNKNMVTYLNCCRWFNGIQR